MNELLKLLDDTLTLRGRGLQLRLDSPLAGTLPELDSMGVVAIVSAAEDHWGIVIEDEEIDAEVFATVGSLMYFLRSKMATH